jgi:sulfur carrier protein ThiS
MKIHFKTGGLFVEHLPAGSIGNTADLEVPAAATPMDVMRQLGMPSDENYLVSLNGEVIVISERIRKRPPGHHAPPERRIVKAVPGTALTK